MTKYVSEDQELDFWSNPILPPNPTRVSASMSGGCDSTMAVVLLSEQFKDCSIEIFPAVGEDIHRVSNAKGVRKILEQLRLLYPMHTFHEPTVYEYDKNDPAFTSKVSQSAHNIKHNCDIMIVGKSLQPDSINVDNRVPGSILEVEQYDSYLMYRPFYNVNKKMIAFLYRQFGLMESIYPLTVSCINMRKSRPQPCKKCPWCQEKKWAFGTYDFGTV